MTEEDRDISIIVEDPDVVITVPDVATLVEVLEHLRSKGMKTRKRDGRELDAGDEGSIASQPRKGRKVGKRGKKGARARAVQSGERKPRGAVKAAILKLFPKVGDEVHLDKPGLAMEFYGEDTAANRRKVDAAIRHIVEHGELVREDGDTYRRVA